MDFLVSQIVREFSFNQTGTVSSPPILVLSGHLNFYLNYKWNCVKSGVICFCIWFRSKLRLGILKYPSNWKAIQYNSIKLSKKTSRERHVPMQVNLQSMKTSGTREIQGKRYPFSATLIKTMKYRETRKDKEETQKFDN